MSLKLYKITCRGMTLQSTTHPSYGIAYVLAENCDEAYSKMRMSLNKRDLGFNRERELRTAEGARSASAALTG